MLPQQHISKLHMSHMSHYISGLNNALNSSMTDSSSPVIWKVCKYYVLYDY